MAQQPLVGQGLLKIEASRSHSGTHHSRKESFGRVIGPTQKNLPDNTQHSQETEKEAHGGIRTPQSREKGGRKPTLFIINNDVKINIINHSLLINIYKISANKQRDCISMPFHTTTAVPKLCTEKPKASQWGSGWSADFFFFRARQS